ncbi:Opr family porin [Desulfurivibrio sp. D14AmB]|uniref:Opr family porin n=1 Tax=Desulfurivibrio sp. D14AmB TaxID=3374370 RepID=UPI00376EFCE1
MGRLLGGLALAGQLLSVPLATAAESIHAAFAQGALAGQVGLYGISGKARDEERQGFISGRASLAYQTAPWQHLSLGLGAWGTTRLHETRDGDYRETVASDALIHLAYLHFAGGDRGELTAGRHQVEQEWLTDHIVGVSARLIPLDNLELSFGWAQRQAVVDLDEVSEGFAKMNEDNGLYFGAAHYSPLAWLTLMPYYYHAADLYRAPGMKLTGAWGVGQHLEAATMIQYVRSNTPAGQEDGDFWWLEQTFAYQDFGFGGGYMRAHPRAGSNIAEFGDQTPFEYGDNIFAADAQTWYLAWEYGRDALSLSALYGHTRYAAGTERPRTKELNLIAGYGWNQHLELELIYAAVRNSSVSVADFNSLSMALTYSF